MKIEKSSKKDLYYTKEHEWIDFQGTVACIGVCAFKLSGFKEVQKVIFNELSGFKKQGDVIATIHYNDWQVEVHMPVDGKIHQVNDTLITGNQDMVLQQPENSGWIALIIPAQPYERKGLMLAKEYQLNGKDKYAK